MSDLLLIYFANYCLINEMDFQNLECLFCVKISHHYLSLVFVWSFFQSKIKEVICISIFFCKNICVGF